MQTKPKKPKTKKIKIDRKVYEALKKKADSANQSVEDYTSDLLGKHADQQEEEKNGPNSR